MRFASRIAPVATAALGVAVIASGGVLALAPAAEAQASSQVRVDDATLAWMVNEESGAGAYFGGCNFLVAGVAGDTGRSTVWNAEFADANYRTEADGTTITKPDAAGVQTQPTWENKCIDASTGKPATTGNGANLSITKNQINLAGGTGVIDPASGSASLDFDGAFTIVYYGGMTYFSLENLRLRVENGQGLVSATASGYGANMYDPTVWEKLPAEDITVATLRNVTVTSAGITVTPEYEGVEVEGDTSGVFSPQDRTKDGWGSFPQSWVDFNLKTGQSAYWYTSGGAADPRKSASPITVAYSASADPFAVLDPPKAVEGSTSGSRISLGGLTGLQGDVTARVAGSDADLPVIGGPASIAAGAASGTWDTSGIGAGTHVLGFFVDGQQVATRDGTAVTVTLMVVAGLTEIAPQGLVASPGREGVRLSWSWPTDPPPDYRVEVFTSDGAAAAREVLVAGESADAAAAVSGLREGTTYSAVVTPRVGDTNGTASRVAFTTLVGSNPPGDDGDDDAPDANPEGVMLSWGINRESSGGAFYGGCNYITASVAGDTGESRVWTQTDFSAFHRPSENVQVVKPNAQGQWVPINWAGRCQDRNGAAVSSNSIESSTESQVQIRGGKIVQNDASGVRVEWSGGFTLAYYGGMTYWSASDPVLELDGSGNGSLTATASGFGASMADASKWVRLSERRITLANFTGVRLADIAESGGFTHTPDYVGVRYSGTGAGEEVIGGGVTATGQAERTAENAVYWGSFPRDFVDFQNETGQFSYWFTSNGIRDRAKPALPVSVSFDADYEVAPGDYSATSPGRSQPLPGGGQGAPGAERVPPAAENVAAAAGRTVQEAVGAVAGAAAEANVTPPMLYSGGAALVSVALLQWLFARFVRRRLGLAPSSFM